MIDTDFELDLRRWVRKQQGEREEIVAKGVVAAELKQVGGAWGVEVRTTLDAVQQSIETYTFASEEDARSALNRVLAKVKELPEVRSIMTY